jgi:hypothetical protein
MLDSEVVNRGKTHNNLYYKCRVGKITPRNRQTKERKEMAMSS